MFVAVGCPIRNRAWIFNEYVEHVRAAFDVAGLKPFWIFAIGTLDGGRDDGTRHIVTEMFRHEPGIWTEMDEPSIREQRYWDLERYEQMAVARNRLLGLVSGYRPKIDYFLSLDSDILIHPSALTCMLETIQAGCDRGPYAAVGGKAFLSEVSPDIVTYGEMGSGMGVGIRRCNSDGVFPVAILMALKLMGPEAYNVPYVATQFGEDIGWSQNCQKEGLVLGWDGRVCSKHIMKPEDLQRVDPRVGW